jgi:hypothetical protein
MSEQEQVAAKCIIESLTALIISATAISGLSMAYVIIIYAVHYFYGVSVN